MARRRHPITVEVAGKALRKLQARDITEAGDEHPEFAVEHEGQIIRTTGLRRASNRGIPVPHVNRDLGVSVRFVLDLARCPKSRDDYLREVGAITDDDDNVADAGDAPTS
jgi:hypothetical protein